MGVPFGMSLTTMRAKESNMAAVFVGLRLSAVGTEWTHVTDTAQF